MPTATLTALPLLLSIVALPWPGGVESSSLTHLHGHFAWPHFDRAVSEYMEIRRLAPPMDVDCLTADREAIHRARARRAAAIRDVRGEASPGTVFGAEVAPLIRRRLTRALGKHPDDFVLLAMLDESSAATAAIVVNGSLPWGATITVTPSLLAALPALPEELEYRLLGRDLILWDSGVDLVVDILADALPAQ
ncbi:MAG TPA: hypothetical protein VI485_19800 [Vicinamibacterales bacterium]|nr:hypothetical protein [Vicinamibacterales bacterium]